MFTIATATGKQFDSDYATTVKEPSVGFVCIVGETLENVRSVFFNKEEMPLDIFPQFKTVASIKDLETSIELVLKP